MVGRLTRTTTTFLDLDLGEAGGEVEQGERERSDE